MSFCTLIEKICQKNNRTVMGLDPKLEYIPDQIKEEAVNKYGNTFEAAGYAIYKFNMGLIDSVSDLIPAIKPQSAFYESYGMPGLNALQMTINYAHEAGLYVVLDAKRGDIGSTAQAYAEAYLGSTKLFDSEEHAFEVDCMTVNPYLGTDGILPFVKVATEYNREIFVLVKTSNPSSGEFQDIEIGAGGKKLYYLVADKVRDWGLDSIDDTGYSLCGAVVGATYPKQLKELREYLPNTFFLIPGYGAQGGSAADVVSAFDKRGYGAIVNSSRALMCAYQKVDDLNKDANYKKHTREAVIAMRDDINLAISRR